MKSLAPLLAEAQLASGCIGDFAAGGRDDGVPAAMSHSLVGASRG